MKAARDVRNDVQQSAESFSIHHVDGIAASLVKLHSIRDETEGLLTQGDIDMNRDGKFTRSLRDL